MRRPLCVSLIGSALLAATGLSVSGLEVVWERLPGHAKDIGVGADGSVWIVGSANRNGTIYRYDGSDWVAQGGSGIYISVGPAGDPWVVNLSSDLYHRVGDQWVLITEHGSATQVGVDTDGTVLIAGGDSCYCGPVTNQKLYRYDPVQGFVLLPGQAVIIQPDQGGRWVINDQGEIFYAASGGDYLKLDGHGRDLAIGANGDLWIIGGAAFEAGNDRIYRWNGAQFELANGGTGRRISVGPDGTPWMVNSADEIFRGHFLQLNAQDASTTNGGRLLFPVVLSYAPDRGVSSSYQVRDPDGVVVANGVLTLSLGVTNTVVSYPTGTNSGATKSGSYRLVLSGAVGADLVRAEAVGTVSSGTTTPPTPVPLSVTLGANGILAVQCPSQKGYTYQLERRSDLSAAGLGWSTVASLAGTGATIQLVDSVPPVSRGFYRVSAVTHPGP